jgi:hypothetical protein
MCYVNREDNCTWNVPVAPFQPGHRLALEERATPITKVLEGGSITVQTSRTKRAGQLEIVSF